MSVLESVEELRVFVQAVESGSLSAAGRALGLPPVTVGRRIAALEQRLGQPVLYRSTRRLSLSESGRVLLDRAHRILGEVDEAEAELEQEHEGLAGRVRITVMSALAAELLDALSHLVQTNPGLHLQVRVNDQFLSPVHDGTDLVITGGHQPDSGLIARKLMDATVVLAASRSYLERAGRPQRPRDLEAHVVLPLIAEPARTAWTLRGPGRKPVTVPLGRRVEIDASRTMLDALAAGLGIGFTSTRALARHPSLERVLPKYEVGRFPLYAVFPSAGRRSRRLRALVNAIEAHLHDR